MFISSCSCQLLKKDYTSQKPPSFSIEKPASVYFTQTDLVNLACKTDSDCVLVDAHCCGCANGGESIAIHKSQKNSYMSQLKKYCSRLDLYSCLAEYRCDYFKAKCMNFQCVTSKQK